MKYPIDGGERSREVSGLAGSRRGLGRFSLRPFGLRPDGNGDRRSGTGPFPAGWTAPLLRFGHRAFGPKVVLGETGALQVRLATSRAEVMAAQRLRFDVFYRNEASRPRRGFAARFDERDADPFDRICDHLLVIDTDLPGPDMRRIVGTYRLLPQERAERAGGFYSAAEFDLAGLVARHPNRRFLELGRSCVLEPYRNKRGIDLLWQGIWAYCRAHRIDVLTGCASFSGTDPRAHGEAMSFLAHHCMVEGEWRVRARADRYAPMTILGAGNFDDKRALASLPPLIKGYLRLGGLFGDGCVVDHEFGTVDVLVVLPIERIPSRYLSHFDDKAVAAARRLRVA